MARRYWIKELWEKCRVNICKRRQAHTSLASEKSWLDHSLRIPFGWTAPKNAKTKRARLDSCRTFACCTQVIQWKEKRRSLLDLKWTLKMIKQKVCLFFQKITVMYKKLIPCAVAHYQTVPNDAFSLISIAYQRKCISKSKEQHAATN